SSRVGAPAIDSSGEQIDLELGATHDRITRLLYGPDDACDVDADEAAAPFFDLAGNEDRLDVARIHEVHHGAGRVAERPDVEPIGLKHNDIGFLAGRERADLAVDVGAAGTRDCAELQQIAAGEQRRKILLALAGTLQDPQALK